MDLLLFFDESVVLGDTPEGELVHEVDLVRIRHVSVREVLYGHREGGGEEHDLTILGVELQELLDDGCELARKQLIGFVHNEHWAFAEVGHILAGQVEDSAGSTDYNMNGVL